MSALPARASVVVVGGGVIGTSIAFHLAEAGVRDVVLVERDQLASGSTSRAAGGVRAQFSDPLNIEIGLRGIAAFSQFDRRPGWEIGHRQDGYLLLLSRPEQVEQFERSMDLQHRHGVPSRMITPQEARRLSPLINSDGLLAAAFCPIDGIATPEAVVQGYASGARALGVHIETSCRVEGVTVRGREIAAVVTDRGVVETGAVVCAAGAWSAQVGEMVGLSLPVVPLRRQVLFTEPIAALPPGLPFTVDFDTSLYFHREGPGLLFGMSYAKETPGFKLEMSDEWMPALTAAVAHRAPTILEAGIKGGWAGLYEVTPDHNAIIGEHGDVARFLYATGFSGHGFMQGPAVGEIVRDLYLRRPPVLDVSPLSVDRFRRDALRPERNVI